MIDSKAFDKLLEEMPNSLPWQPTFLEIAGYPHYENVCSNILKFFFSHHNRTHGLNDLILKSLLQCVSNTNPIYDRVEHLEVKREVPTTKGRIDLLLIAPKWAIIIENKIWHKLNNDLAEYTSFIREKHPDRTLLNIVLSIRPENNLTGNFINITYDKFVETVEKRWNEENIPLNEYTIYLKQFLITIRNLYNKIIMDKVDIEYLLRNQEKIEELIAMEEKLKRYIEQRAIGIKDKVSIGPDIDKWVWGGYDIGFTYKHGDNTYKLEMAITKESIYITICVEPNIVIKEVLQKLNIFKEKKCDEFPVSSDNSRLILKEKIDFFEKDENLVSLLNSYLLLYKVNESS